MGPSREEAAVTLEDLFDAHARSVRRYLLRRLGSVGDPSALADDLTAEVFIVAWRRRADIPSGSELPWLYAVARRVLANERRRPTDVPVADLSSLDAIDDSDPADLVTDDAVLAAAWRSVSSTDREVLRLSAWEGLSGQALADALGISTGGAGAALSRARSRLAAEISRADVQDSPDS